MKFWITGSNGFLAKLIHKTCKANGFSFVSTSKNEVDISSLEQVYRFIESNAQDPITHIVNCAALAHVDLAEKNPEAAFAVNTLGPENLGKVASCYEIPILHFSSEYVFNGCGNGIFSEEDIPIPLGVYAETKREGELRLLNAHQKSCIIRTSWLFGGNGKTFLSSMFDRIKNNKILKIASDQKNRATYIKDLAEKIFFFFEHQGIFHFANQGIVSRYEIAKTMWQYAKESSLPILCEEILPMNSNAFIQLNKRPSSCILDTSKIEETQKSPIRTWDKAVRDLVLSDVVISPDCFSSN